jgi:N-acyl-D-aspartate/D-glutamate deacylase
VILGIGTAVNPFSLRPSYRQLEGLSVAEQLRRLRDPSFRRAILAETASEEELRRLPTFRRAVTTRWDKLFALGDPPDYEPGPEASIAAIAERRRMTPDEVAYDYLTEAEHRFLLFPVINYNTGDFAVIHEMLRDPATLLGLADGGAHCLSIVDSGVPSYMLLHWGRDRVRGPRLPLELLVKRQTSETADYFGLSDRGRIAPGLRADINVIDFAGLRLGPPEIVADMPSGGRRLVQRVRGYEATLVAGVPVFERGAHTGALPGRLVRAGRL